MIPVVWIAMGKVNNTFLPGLSKVDTTRNLHPSAPRGMNKKEQKKYRGFEDFLKAKNKNSLLVAAEKKKKVATQIRAAFFVDWDPQSLYSLQNHINELNTVLPEWFFIDPEADTLKTDIDKDAYELMKKSGIRILPMLNNVDLNRLDGTFDPKILDATLNDPVKREHLLNDISAKLKQYGLQGINIDFEELNDKVKDAVHVFQKELYQRLHAEGMMVTQDVMADDDDFDLKELSRSNDYIFLMAYDQHYSSSVPGPVSDQHWVEKELDEVAKGVPPGKIILGMAGYGYDWPDKEMAATITYQEALSTAKEFKATIDFDNDSYNCTYQYTDYNKIHHTVHFMDAAGLYNIMRFADEYSTAGVALWRLGAEDERVWKFYNRDLSNEAIRKEPYDLSLLASLDITTEKPDYIEDGEVLDVVSEPEKGIIDLETDQNENLISEENYKQLPTRYVIKRFGQVSKQVILTFDDGPDPSYTPRILDILKKDTVPAVFFIVGMNGEAYLPLLKRI
ncbi:MAG TPA: glycosyl hydrolase family 18 protein, partial [Chitinophagaceae bacterium]